MFECICMSRLYTYLFNAHSHAHSIYCSAPQSGVCGNKQVGCHAIIVSNGRKEAPYNDQLDSLTYTASNNSGGHAVLKSMSEKGIIRVFRSSSAELNPFRALLMERKTAYRYDGLYKVTSVTYIDNTGNVRTETPENLSDAVTGRTCHFDFQRLQAGDDVASNRKTTEELMKYSISHGTMGAEAEAIWNSKTPALLTNLQDADTVVSPLEQEALSPAPAGSLNDSQGDDVTEEEPTQRCDCKKDCPEASPPRKISISSSSNSDKTSESSSLACYDSSSSQSRCDSVSSTSPSFSNSDIKRSSHALDTEESVPKKLKLTTDSVAAVDVIVELESQPTVPTDEDFGCTPSSQDALPFNVHFLESIDEEDVLYCHCGRIHHGYPKFMVECKDCCSRHLVDHVCVGFTAEEKANKDSWRCDTCFEKSSLQEYFSG